MAHNFLLFKYHYLTAFCYPAGHVTLGKQFVCAKSYSHRKVHTERTPIHLAQTLPPCCCRRSSDIVLETETVKVFRLELGKFYVDFPWCCHLGRFCLSGLSWSCVVLEKGLIHSSCREQKRLSLPRGPSYSGCDKWVWGNGLDAKAFRGSPSK